MDTIGVDIGSSNVKAVLSGPDGVSRAVATRALVWERAGEVAEQDAVALWAAVVDALGELAATLGPGGLGEVAAIGLCGQYSSIVAVDEALEPLAPMRLYLDTRGTAHCYEIMEREPDAFVTWLEHHPIPPVGGGLALGHLLALQIDEPELHARTRAYLEPVDYVAARLTGKVAGSQVSMFASQLIDNRSLGQLAYDAELVRMSGVDPAKLPPLVAPDAKVGTVRADLCAQTGLPATAVVVAGMTDSHAAALATGADQPGRVGIAVGTTAVVLAAARAIGVDLDHEVLAMPGIRPESYLVWAENGLAGRAVEHVLDRFVHASDPLGVYAVADPFVGFEDALAESVPGAKGLRFLPWLSGSLAPAADPTVRGGFVGMSLDTERVDLVRAAAEGVAHNLRWLLEPVDAFTGTSGTEVVLTGGAARSPGWSQILADVLQRSVRTIAEPGHAGARAASAWARAAVGGALADAGDGPGPGSSWGPRYEPDPEVAGVYDAGQAAFTAVFEALRPLGLGTP